jgi:ribose transport system substrate-binding protein
LAAALKPFSGAAIVAAARSRPGLLAGSETAATMLHDHPELNALVCSSAQDTIGAAQVVVDMNLVGRIVIIGADETPEIRRYIDKGVIAASIVRDSRWIGVEAVRAFRRLKEARNDQDAGRADFFIRTPRALGR